MIIRNYQPGDEAEQADIYNDAAQDLPGFRAIDPEDVRRFTRSRNFNASGYFFAEEGSRLLGYCGFAADGRISYPWTRRGSEAVAEPLLRETLDAMQERGFQRAFAAYRTEWLPQLPWLSQAGFQHVRSMINFVLDLTETPTQTTRAKNSFGPLEASDIPRLHQMCPGLIRVELDEFEKHLTNNPYFGPESIFVLRGPGRAPMAAGLVITDEQFAAPRQLDGSAPNFRLGAFGNEGLQAERVCGLFSFLVQNERDLVPMALDMMQYAIRQLEGTEAESIAGQVPSDYPTIVKFFERYFHKQGSFPVWEKRLS